MIVPPGISQRAAKYDSAQVNLETVANELTLLNLGDFEPLRYKIDTNLFMQEISRYDGVWADYLPRLNHPNNRQGLALMNLPGKNHLENPSLAEASLAAGRRLSEIEFSEKTEVYNACTSLKPFLEDWQPLGRTFLVKCNSGGHFLPHRDHPSMPRDVFRLAVFLNNVAPLQFDWLMDDRKLNIELGRVYYVNTRKTHRTISWVNDSIHMILNVPMTSENVSRLIASLQHTH